MSVDPVTHRVFEVIADQAERPVAEIGPDTSLDSLGIDSLGMMEIVFALEEAFDIEIPDSPEVTSRLQGMATAGSAAELVLSLLVAA